mgnify:CR=1 FL=1
MSGLGSAFEINEGQFVRGDRIALLANSGAILAARRDGVSKGGGKRDRGEGRGQRDSGRLRCLCNPRCTCNPRNPHAQHARHLRETECLRA